MLINSYSALSIKHDLLNPCSVACTACVQVATGALPHLLLLCCGSGGAPEGLQEAAAAATAAAAAALKTAAAASANVTGTTDTCHGGSLAVDMPRALGSSTSMCPAAAAGSSACDTARVGDALNSIAEPQNAAECDSEEGAQVNGSAASSRVASASQGVRDSGDGVKKGKKGAAKADPAQVAASEQATAAIKLIAFAGDSSRVALLSSGALPVLLPLLKSASSTARWNARQVLCQQAT